MISKELKAEMEQASKAAKQDIINCALRASTLVEALEIAKKETIRDAKTAEMVMSLTGLEIDFPSSVGDTCDLLIEVVKQFEAKNKETSFAN